MRLKNRLYHVWLFYFGYLYYLIIPLIAVQSRVWEDFPGMNYLYLYFKKSYVCDYLAIVFLIGMAFGLGVIVQYHSKRKYRIKKNQVSQWVANNKSMMFLLIPLLLYCQYVIIQNRSYLFQGYLLELDSPFVGTIATTTILILFFFLYNKLSLNDRIVNKVYTLVLLELSIVLLGLGTRMYVMVPFVSIMIYMIDLGKITARKVLMVGGCVVFLILSIGIWRLGHDNFSWDQLVFIGIAEPTFTWLSAISMYDMNQLPIFAVPYQFITSFINFLPSTLFPDKAEWIAPIPLQFDSPFGATSLFLSLISNFGIVGCLFVMFFLGYLLTYVRLNWNSIFGRTYYYCLCGIVPFQLFRDGFDIINKEVFFTFFILPAIFWVITKKRKLWL